MRKRLILLASAVGVFMVTTACGSSQSSNEANEAANDTAKVEEPAEVSFYLNSMSQVMYDAIAEKAKAKFPNYTLISVPNSNAGGPTFEAMLTTGSVPDIYVTRGVERLAESGLSYDISELIKTMKFDQSRIDESLWEHMRNDTGGKLVGIPLSSSVRALHYNKDLFDKFGVPYPKDGMTWDDVYDMAKRMTRTEDGVLYRGYVERWMDMFFDNNPYGETYLSLTEDKAAVNTEGWRKIIENFQRFYTLPGLQFDAKTISKEQDWRIFIDGRSAMTIFTSRNFMNWSFDWDIVSFPTYKDKPGVGSPADSINLYIMSTSKNKEAAFKVAAWLVSDEMQAYLASDFGNFPSIKNEEIRKQFQKNDSLYKGKNVNAYLYNKVTPVVPGRKPGLVSVNATTPFMKELEKLILENKDINSVQRAAEEAINKAIAAEKAK